MNDLSIWCCCYRDIKSETVQCLEYFRRQTKLDYTFNIISGDALIGRVRSMAATQFIEKSSSSFMLFIDDDIIFRPEDIEKIYQNMKDGYEVIGGCYSTRDGQFLAQSNMDKDIIFNNDIHEIEYVSTGFLGITKNVLEQIIKKCNLSLLHEDSWIKNYPFFESGQFSQEKIYISEDWDFCNKVRKAGFKVYIDTSIQLGHIGEKIYIIKDVQEHYNKKSLLFL